MGSKSVGSPSLPPDSLSPMGVWEAESVQVLLCEEFWTWNLRTSRYRGGRPPEQMAPLLKPETAPEAML